MSALRKNRIAERVGVARVGLGLSQDELGKRIGLTRQQVTDIEGGVRSIKAEELEELASALEIDVKQLLYQSPA